MMQFLLINMQKKGTINRAEKKLDVHHGLRHYVARKLDKYWSPQQISGRFTKDFPTDKGMRISHETIYAYVYAMPKSDLRRELIAKLRRAKNLYARAFLGFINQVFTDNRMLAI